MKSVSKRGNAFRILIVDNDPADAESARCSLAASPNARFVVQVASSLAGAVEMLRAREFHAVLLNLNLRDSRGLATLNAISAQCADQSAIVCTGVDDESTATAAVHGGAQDYLMKGHCSGEMLARAVAYSIQRHRNEREIRNLLWRVRENERLLQDKNKRLAALNDVAHQVVENVSHEFRTPLTVIREYTSLMRDGFGGELTDDHRRFVEIVSDRADDLATMVDDLLDISRIEAGLLGMARSKCHVADIVDRVRIALQRKARIRQVQLEIDVSPELPPVFCDPEKAGRILTNLTANAIKFCGESGHVVISAADCSTSKEIIVSVEDNGQGIDDESLAKIFGRHQQLPNATARAVRGFGLGLSIAEELVECSFGQLNVASRPSEGSTFSFTLPHADPNEILGRYLSRLELNANGGRMVSLVVVSIQDSIDRDLADDVDAFLTYLLRRNDLLLRIQAHRWLMVLDAGRTELGEFTTRYEKTLRQTNRNRIHGPLPKLHRETGGTWQLPRQHAQVVSEAERWLAQGEPVLA